MTRQGAFLPVAFSNLLCGTTKFDLVFASVMTLLPFVLFGSPVAADDGDSAFTGAPEAAFTGAPESGEVSEGSAELVTAGKEWAVLHLVRKPMKPLLTLPEDSKVVDAVGMELVGPYPKDPFLFGNFTADSNWGIKDGWLHRAAGENGAVRIARAEDFDLQGIFNAEGLGGWFMLLGWETGHGYMVYNVSLKESGSPWHLCEFRDSKAIANTHREFTRFEWKGAQPLMMTVQDRELTIKVGRTVVADAEPLPNYHAGQIIIGTYNTDYGAKRLGIRSLRIRGKGSSSASKNDFTSP